MILLVTAALIKCITIKLKTHVKIVRTKYKDVLNALFNQIFFHVLYVKIIMEMFS